MLTLATLWLVAGASSNAFHIDNINPGEGVEGDCFTAFWREGATPVSNGEDPPHVFEEIGDSAFIKIDGQVHSLRLNGATSAGQPQTYSDATVTVTESHHVTRKASNKEEDYYWLRATLKVTYGGKTQKLATQGVDYCYHGD